MHRCTVVCISTDETKAAVSLYLKFCRSPPVPPTMTDNQAYGTKMTNNPMTTNNPACGPMTTYHNEAYDHIDPEYVIVDDIQDHAPPRPLPIPAVKSKDQTSSPDYSATDYEIPTPQNKQ